MLTNPVAQHQWLKRFVGSWAFETECSMGPDTPPFKSSGVETVRMLGDLWIIAESQGEMPGGTKMDAIITLGYDPARERFIGTWVGSPSTALFVYEGQLDASGNILPLNTTGPSFADPTKTVPYQDVLELQGDDKRLLWSQTPGPDGQWHRFMTATYRRTK